MGVDRFQVSGQIDLFSRAPGTLVINRTQDLLLVLCPESRELFCVDPVTGRPLGDASGFELGAFEPLFAGDHTLVTQLRRSNQLAICPTSHLFHRIAFASNREGGSYQLYIMALDGKKLLRLTDGPSTNRSPRWSPDGRQIAFISNRAGPDRICVINPDGSSPRVFGETDPVLGLEGDASLDWSPDGREIAFIGHEHRAIRVVDVETSQIRTLLSGKFVKPYGYHNGLSWDRAGNRILFNSQDPTYARTQDLFALDPETLQVAQLTKDGPAPTYWLSSTASSDGRTIAAIHEQSRSVGAPFIRNVILLDRTGRFIRQLTRTQNLPHTNPRWFPDAQRLLYSAGPEGHNQLYWVRIDGSGVNQLTTGHWHDVEPDIWRRPQP